MCVELLKQEVNIYSCIVNKILKDADCAVVENTAYRVFENFIFYIGIEIPNAADIY